MDKIDHAIGFLALDWLQWGDKWNEERAEIALKYISQLKAENARYIERLEELTSELSKLKVQADRHREALEFYADKTNYSYYCYEYNLKTCGDDELGSHAREALKGDNE